jgi:hypothetical protein
VTSSWRTSSSVNEMLVRGLAAVNVATASKTSGLRHRDDRGRLHTPVHVSPDQAAGVAAQRSPAATAVMSEERIPLPLSATDHTSSSPAISLAVFGINMFGDTLRDVLDPRLRGIG